MNHQQSLIDARARLKALPPSDDVSGVLHMVENNLALSYGRRVKAFDGAFVASEVARVLAGNQGATSGIASTAASSAQKGSHTLGLMKETDADQISHGCNMCGYGLDDFIGETCSYCGHQGTRIPLEQVGCETDSAPSKDQVQEKKEDHGAGLIHQTIPDVDDTEPRPNIHGIGPDTDGGPNPSYVPTNSVELGYNIDMLDADRLREWARLFETFGPDVTHWGSVPKLIERLRDLADRVEKEVREVGELRAL